MCIRDRRLVVRLAEWTTWGFGWQRPGAPQSGWRGDEDRLRLHRRNQRHCRGGWRPNARWRDQGPDQTVFPAPSLGNARRPRCRVVAAVVAPPAASAWILTHEAEIIQLSSPRRSAGRTASVAKIARRRAHHG